MKTSPRPQKRPLSMSRPKARPVDLGMTEQEKVQTQRSADRLTRNYAKGGCVMAGRGGKYKGMK